jgi:hypothetical protein
MDSAGRTNERKFKDPKINREDWALLLAGIRFLGITN